MQKAWLLYPKANIERLQLEMSAKCQKQMCHLFEDLVGGDHEALRDGDAERLGGLQVDVDFEFR